MKETATFARSEHSVDAIGTRGQATANAASVREIDRRNIFRATTVAMRRALDHLQASPGHIVIDGLQLKHLGREHDAVVDGDALIHSLGCASIVAKVIRDRLMRRLALRYPGHGWERNVGYGTAEHRRM